MTLTPPPHPFDPKTATIAAGTLLYRVHEPAFPSRQVNDGTVANLGYGRPTRFAFFGDPVVPVLYVADQPAGAVHESILHDAAPGAFIPQVQWRTKMLSVLRTGIDLHVAAFHSDGLRRFGLYPADLTDTDPTAYPHTVAWAEAAWGAGLSGVAHMCRHYNTAKAFCLFAGRLPVKALEPLPDHPDTRVFSLPTDAEWLASLAWAMRVVLRP